jgi:tetratricopeptide (TPR) repeat protein
LGREFLEFEAGLALQIQGKMEEAAACYRRHLQAHPDSAEGHFHLGAILHVQGQIQQAAGHYERAVASKPDYTIAYNNLGASYHDLGLHDRAIAAYHKALELRPDYADALNNLATVLNDRSEHAEAAECCRRAIEIDPSYAAAHNNLGIALVELGKTSQAIASYQASLSIEPNSASAHCNLGSAWWRQSSYGEAENALRRAISLKPGYAEAYNNLGSVLQDTGRFEEAQASFQKALELVPNYADAHWNLSIIRLMQGDLDGGWREYEWRWRCKSFKAEQKSVPKWEGQSLAGKSIHVYAEQGLGDTLQFVRYVPLLAHTEAKVFFECQECLIPLLAASPVSRLLNTDGPPPPADYCCPLLSLPRLLTSPINCLADRVPYLFAATDLIERWKTKLAAVEGFKVGIAWQGNPQYPGDRSRSIPLTYFNMLTELPGVRLVSLQKGAGTEQLASLPERDRIVEFSGEVDATAGSFMDTAAIMKNLDLVITSDTAIAHLAGALGVPVWVALPFVPDWRWFLNRNDSPWYPTMRLYRQKTPGSWHTVFEQMNDELRSFI